MSENSAHNKILLILDVDETLLFASEHRLAHAPDFAAGPYFVYLRPHLHEFLHNAQSRFQLAIWSSSSANYLYAVLQAALPPDVKLQFVWSRERCVYRYDTEWGEYYFVKDLRKVKRLGFDLDRMLIVDDTPKKVERNYGNAIYVRPYLGEDEADDELPRLSRYLDSLSLRQNLRSLEKRSWRSHV